MHNRIHISNSYLTKLPVRQSKIPRKRFIKYYHDLYSLHHLSLSAKTFLTGSQYSYTELGSEVFKKTADNHVLNDIDLLFMITWTPEFDPEYASAGAYLIEQFKLNCKTYDIGDHGTLGFFTGLDLIQKYLYSNQFTKVFVLVMEQNSVPRSERSQVLMPQHNFVFGLTIQTGDRVSPQGKNYHVVSSGVLSGVIKKTFHEIYSQLNKYNSDKTIRLICKKDGTIYKKYQREMKSMAGIHVANIPNTPGNFSLFSYLHYLISEGDDFADVLMFDEDVETSDVGYLILRRANNESSV